MGARVRKLRKEKGISFDALVGETGLGRGYISELERGLVNPTIGNLDLVAQALGVSLAELLTDDSNGEQS
ncbi:MAG: helix-turn-helix domain-containing protein [Polyangiaceae bacterium]